MSVYEHLVPAWNKLCFSVELPGWKFHAGSNFYDRKYVRVLGSCFYITYVTVTGAPATNILLYEPLISGLSEVKPNYQIW